MRCEIKVHPASAYGFSSTTPLTARGRRAHVCLPASPSAPAAMLGDSEDPSYLPGQSDECHYNEPKMEQAKD